MPAQGTAHELPPNAVHLHLPHLKKMVQQRDTETFAKALNLDPGRTGQWFDEGLTHQGYGAEVIRALGTLVLMKILAPSGDSEGHAHG